MTRFVHIQDKYNDLMINTRGIVGVSNVDEETVTLELFDGTSYHIDRSFLPEITGDEAITQVVISPNIHAFYGENFEPQRCAKVFYMALTASGRMRPMDQFYNFMDVAGKDGQPFIGLGSERDRGGHM